MADPLPGRIPVLTVRQPWHWALTCDQPDASLRKPVENRTWTTRHRGSVWLHAGARSRWDPDGASFPLLRSAWDRYVCSIAGWPGLPSSDVELGRRTTLMPFGAVAALAKLAACHRDSDCDREVNDFARVEWCSPWAMPDQYHWEFTEVIALPEPVPCKGSLGLWYLPPEVEAAVREQIGAAR
jgi:hypothetical protein